MEKSDRVSYRQDKEPVPPTEYEKHQVVIIGAGPTGLFLALKLVQQGIDVCVLEADDKISDAPRAAAYMPIVMHEMEKVGILSEFASIAHQTNRGVEFRTPSYKGNELLGVLNLHLLPKGINRYPYISLIAGQDVLGALILRYASKYPNFSIKWGHRYVGVSRESGNPKISCVTNSGERFFEANYLVGADGAGSSVRRSFEGFTWNDFRFVAINMIYDFTKYAEIDTGCMVMDEEDWAIIARVTKEEQPGTGVWRVAFGIRTTIPEEKINEEIERKLQRLMPGPRPLKYKIVSCNPYWAHQRVAQTLKVGNVMLCGDAAHSNNPIGGLGLTTGLLDAAALGSCLIRILAKGESDSNALLEKYAQVRRKAFVEYTNPQSIQAKLRIHCQDEEYKKIREDFLQSINDPEVLMKMAKAMNEVVDDEFEQS